MISLPLLSCNSGTGLLVPPLSVLLEHDRPRPKALRFFGDSENETEDIIIIILSIVGGLLDAVGAGSPPASSHFVRSFFSGPFN